MPLPDQVALVLQGGGALGSYQAGVIEGLTEARIDIDWVAGISIGAINAALVAGNPPARRMERLAAFWEQAGAGLPDLALPDGWPFGGDEWARGAAHLAAAGWVALTGVPGFFAPNTIPPPLAVPGSPFALAPFDSRPLIATLDALVDWDRVNDGPMRMSVGAVEVESGNLRFFDTTSERLDARHVLASGALPPGLPPVEIDGRLWWDGGLVSNTPLAHVLDHQQSELLVFQVDLFAAAGKRPRTIADVLAREKDIRYSSRTRQVTDQLLRVRHDRAAMRRVLAKLPAAMADDPDVRALTERAAEQPVSLVHLIYRAAAWESGARDVEFSRATMREHWAAGRAAVDRTMANAQLVAENIVEGRTAAFDLNR